TANRIIPGGVNSPVRAFQQVGGTPVYFQSASGSSFKDADGNKYIDFCQSWGPLILGHAYPSVVEAVCKAARDGLSFGACHKKEIQFAENILDAFPGFDTVRTVNSGTEAVMTALRLARGVTGRSLIVKFDGGYHGHFDGMLVKAGSGLATHAIASSAGIPDNIASSTIVIPFDDEKQIRTVFEEKGSDIAAVILEPLPANNGLLIQRNELLEFIREITLHYDTKLIFDEVITGFRLQYGGFMHRVGIQPDIITLGKIIGGGMPVGAVVGKHQDMCFLAPSGTVYQAGTLSGNPVALAAGIATLNEVKSNPPYQKLKHLSDLFIQQLRNSGIEYAKAQAMDSILWLYLDSGKFPRSASAIAPIAMERFKSIYWRLLEKGYYLPPSSFEVLFLSAAHTESEVLGFAGTLIKELQIP
ncbi:glutamate-1-semialdehyde 2,1-aminomutase, partial [bacterium]|nr:glutamate-1-semialdehyde 2,1-aminomutase [candidate division CSSED10-310 bacterium]